MGSGWGPCEKKLDTQLHPRESHVLMKDTRDPETYRRPTRDICKEEKGTSTVPLVTARF